MMGRPDITASRGDRDIECAQAIEQAFQMLVREAQEAGWTRDEVLVALHELSASAFLFSVRPVQLH